MADLTPDDQILRAAYAEVEPGGPHAPPSGIALAVRPVFWQGRVARVAVVAVPYAHRSVLYPQIAASSFDHLRGWPATAAP